MIDLRGLNSQSIQKKTQLELLQLEVVLSSPGMSSEFFIVASEKNEQSNEANIQSHRTLKVETKIWFLVNAHINHLLNTY